MGEVITSSVLTAPHGFPTRGAAPRPLVTVDQVHGTRVVEARTAADKPGEADAVWTEALRVGLGIKTADCVPLLLEDPVGRRVAAVHAGWRGAIAEIPMRAVEVFVGRGSRPADVRAAIGPCIRPCCYVVGEDLALRFAQRFGASVVQRREGQVYLDLPRAVRLSLEQLGVGKIDEAGALCTSCDRRFHSFRREQGAPGRQVSFIVCEWPRGPLATRL